MHIQTWLKAPVKQTRDKTKIAKSGPNSQLNKTRKCIHSRAYHKARKEAENAGKSPEEAKKFASQAAAAAVLTKFPTDIS